jgi:hypothetical protein
LIIVRFANLLRDQEWDGYRKKYFKEQQRKRQFELQLHAKKPEEKLEAEREAEKKKLMITRKEKIEVDALREGFKNVIKTKYINEWRLAK